MNYDWLIIGAGLYGAVFARELTDAGYNCLVVEKRPYIGGNCADEWIDDILVTRHGGHIFHTNDRDTWEYVNRFAEFWPYRHRVKVSYRDVVYSFPINLMTMQQVFGINTPGEARKYFKDCKKLNGRTDNLEAWAKREIGPALYKMFIEGYTRKQWGREPGTLPAAIIKRIPVRLTFNDDYFSDTYQGMPVNGYSAMIDAMLAGIDKTLDCDYLENRVELDGMAARKLYTGPIDELFGCDRGVLEYRSLRWQRERYENMDFLGCAAINYTGTQEPYTRVIEYKHFMQCPPAKTVIDYEYPLEWEPGRERYYPVNSETNNVLAADYRLRAETDGYEVGGRLGLYRYYDMHQIVARARQHAAKVVN